MSLAEIISRYGRRFVLMDFGEHKYFDFYEIKVERGEVFAVNQHVLLYADEEILAREEVKMPIEELGDMLELYIPEESVCMVLNTDFGRLCIKLYQMVVEFRELVFSFDKVSEKRLYELNQEIIKAARRIELAKTFRKYYA